MTLDPNAKKAAYDAALPALNRNAAPFHVIDLAIEAYIASRPSAIVEEPMAVTEAVTALDGFVEGLLGSMDWVGTGTVKSGAADEKEARDDWTRIRAALNAALTGEVTVKPLEWHKWDARDSGGSADTIVGHYHVWTHHEANGRWFWRLSTTGLGPIETRGECATEAEGKALAQADYTARIRSAIAP